MTLAAAIQFTATHNIDENTQTLDRLIREAAQQGATLISTPENSDFIFAPASEKIKICPHAKDHPTIPHMQKLAAELKVILIIGSISVKFSESKMSNRCYVINAVGDIIDTYDKIHLFDVSLPNGEGYKESEFYAAGYDPKLSSTDAGIIGLSICYDLRFPQQYRDYAKSGAQILTIPAAFTVPTGHAHWEPLLRARAIENGAYVIAAAQTGTHHGDRKTYGHAMIISPWGEILAEAGQGEEIIMATIDLDKVAQARQSIPSLNLE